ncbi:MAG: hypothetical protein ACK4OO_03335, partial [bacterium]
MKVSFISSLIVSIFFSVFLVFSLSVSLYASVVKIDRLTDGVHDLYLFFADSLFTPDIAYDRVMERMEIAFNGEALSESLQESLKVLPPSSISRRIAGQPEEGRLFIYLSTPVHIRTYQLDPPPVLIVQLE